MFHPLAVPEGLAIEIPPCLLGYVLLNVVIAYVHCGDGSPCLLHFVLIGDCGDGAKVVKSTSKAIMTSFGSTSVTLSVLHNAQALSFTHEPCPIRVVDLGVHG